MKLYDPLEGANKVLKNSEFNLRERLNVYTGMIGGLLSPIIFTRYFALPLESESPSVEALKWVVSLPAVIFTPITLAAGTALGVSSAIVERMAREERERRENTLIQKVFNL